jgi:energy-coupling factor transport system ATP-binding protein
MIRFEHVTFTYPGAAHPALNDVTVVAGPGELGLVVGLSGSGKSTLLRAVNGLVPRFSGGALDGRVTVDGRDTRDFEVRNLAGLVGYVGQDPATTFVADRVETELAYSMEQQGLEPATMRVRVEEALDLMGIADLRGRQLGGLSAGQAQRVAMAAALTTHPKVLVLDEPTSALDPGAAEQVMAAITRLVHDLDMTVLMAEHRLERVVQFADLVLYVHDGGRLTSGDPRSVLAHSQVAPPVVQLGKALGFSPIPLTIREAKRQVGALGLVGAIGQSGAQGQSQANREPEIPGQVAAHDQAAAPSQPATPLAWAAQTRQPVKLTATGLRADYGPITAVNGVDLELAGGVVTGVMGRNGAGKSTLLWLLQGGIKPLAGKVQVHPAPEGNRPAVAMVPARPTDLFWAATVDQELGTPAARAIMEHLAPEIDPAAHPRDLSEGQRLALALAIQLASGAPVLALDEPTRGLDYQAKARLAQTLRQQAGNGRAIVVVSHDVEFLAQAVDRVVWLANGEVIADGPANQVLTAVPAHAPQVAKVFSPLKLLTVAQAVDAATKADLTLSLNARPAAASSHESTVATSRTAAVDSTLDAAQ